MRIANIIEEGKLGGPQVRIARVANALKGRVLTTVIMPDENSESFRAKCRNFGVPYQTFRMSRITRELQVAIRYIFFMIPEILRLARYLKRSGVDLVHVSGGSWQYKGVIAGRLAGRRVLWHLNDTSMPWLIRRLFVALNRYSDGYIYSSERSKEYYKPLVKKKKPEFVIPAPVDTTLFDPSQQYDGDKDLLKRWEGKIVIGMVANINPIKGIDVFIHTAAALNQKLQNLIFVVVGGVFKSQQRYYRRLQRLCAKLSADNVEFVGGRDNVRPLLQRFNVYVCSSLAESSPLSVWEAMSMGKAIVSTDVGDVAKYILNGFSGEVVPVGDAIALALRVRDLLSDSARVERYGKEARRIALEKLDIMYCADRHIQAYEKISGFII